MRTSTGFSNTFWTEQFTTAFSDAAPKADGILLAMRSSRGVFVFLLGAVGVLSQPGCSNKQLSALRVADVSVGPLGAHQLDRAAEFPERFPLQVAVLWTKPEEAGLGMVHSLREMGIPFFWTRDLDQALKHPLILLYPSVDAKTFTVEQADRVARYVEAGGTIFAQNVFWGGLKPIFGFSAFQPSRSRHWVAFRSGEDAIFRYLDRPEEQKAPLGSDAIKEIFWTNGYSVDPTAKVLATFEDGTAALLSKTLGKGKSYLAGVGLDDVTRAKPIQPRLRSRTPLCQRFRTGNGHLDVDTPCLVRSLLPELGPAGNYSGRPALGSVALARLGLGRISD